MKKPDIKLVVLGVLFIIGDVLLVLLGTSHIVFFMISAIPLVLVFPLLWLWNGKEAAKAYGKIMGIILAVIFSVGFIIIPLIVGLF